MKVGSLGTRLHLVYVEPEKHSWTSFTYVACVTDWTDAVSSLEVTKQGMHSEQWWQEDRADRVKMLRARVRSGTYRVDSMALAECILKNEVYPIEGRLETR